MIAHVILAQAAYGPADSVPIDFNTVITTIVGGLVSIVIALGTAWINKTLKDGQAKSTMINALTGAMGVANTALTGGLKSHPLQIRFPGISPATAAGVQYMFDHAAPEAARLGITSDAIVKKVEARVGLLPTALTAPVPAALA
jgi:hypothetical protein